VNNLSEHIQVFPENAHKQLASLCVDLDFYLKLKKKRKSKLGDFTYPRNGETPKITLNEDENLYRNLITFLHELAHLLIYLEHGKRRDPHGPAWKKQYSRLLHMFLQTNTFPYPLDEAIKLHLLKPKASSHADSTLLDALRFFDQQNEQVILKDLPVDQLFKLHNGKIYQKGELRRTRILCRDVQNQRKYLIHAYAEVTTVE
jgi:hypothetical protein